jgi:hypothetical protein
LILLLHVIGSTFDFEIYLLHSNEMDSRKESIIGLN